MPQERHRSATVDVWVAGPTEDDAGAWSVHLDAAERRRAERLPALQASRFVQARALLRGVLGARLACSPAAVVLRVACPACGGQHGAVTVADGRPFVSITRSGALIAVATTEAGPVGVDIEAHAAVAAAPLTGVLPTQEPAGLRRAGRTTQPASVARSWVTAEAVLKASGTGLSADPAQVQVLAGRRPRTALTPGGARVLTADLDLGPGVAGAVALAPEGSGTAARPGHGDLLRGRLGRPGRPGLTVRLHDGDVVLARLAASSGWG